MRTIEEDLDYTAQYMEKHAIWGKLLAGGGALLTALMLKQYGEEGWGSWSRGYKGRRAIRKSRDTGGGPAVRTGAVHINESPSKMQPRYMQEFN